MYGCGRVMFIRKAYQLFITIEPHAPNSYLPISALSCLLMHPRSNLLFGPVLLNLSRSMPHLLFRMFLVLRLVTMHLLCFWYSPTNS